MSKDRPWRLTVLVLVALVAGACGGSGRPVALNPGTVDPATTSSVPPPPAPPPPSTSAPTSTSTSTSTTVPAPRPPYPVSEETFPLVDPTRPTVSHGRTISPSRALTTQVWAPRAPGRLPLVVFAHGFQVGPGPYETLVQAWAAHGYIVALPEFPLTDQALAGANLDENDIRNQPADVRFVTDWLVGSSSPLAPRIDPGRVAVAGHSDGGETALGAGVAPVPAGEPAYRAVLAMSVQPLVNGQPTSNPPILVTQGDADTINPPDYGYQTYSLASSPKYLLVIHGAEHLPPLEAGSRWLPGVEAATEAFLDAYAARTVRPPAIAESVEGSALFSLQAG